MKLKELKELIEGCHPEDLNNNLEAVVVTANNNIFSTESIRLDTDSGRIIIAAKSSDHFEVNNHNCLLYTSPSPRDRQKSRMPSSA